MSVLERGKKREKEIERKRGRVDNILNVTICKMAVCMFWLLTYVGQGLYLAVGNRAVIIVHGAQGLDYRHGSNGIRKKSELNSVGSNLLHFRIYPSEGPHRDDLSNWLVFNDEPRISSWSPTDMLIDDIVKEPREFQNVFSALSPAMLDVLYPEYVTSPSQTSADPPLVYDDLHDNRQQHQRTKKRRVGCRHSKRSLNLPMLLVCDEAGKKTLQEPRQSNHDDLYEQRFNTATSTKTDFARAEDTPRESPNGDFIPRAFVYETNKLPGKRNYISVGRRSIDTQGESPGHQTQASSSMSSTSSALPGGIASHFMLRSIRGTIQYDVPQIGKCVIVSSMCFRW